MRDTTSFGYWVRRRRKALDLTQQALAAQVACAAITIRKIEADELRPSAQITERLAACFGLEGDEQRAFLIHARSPGRPGELPIAQQPVAALTARLQAPPLPTPPTPLIGRTQEVAVARDLLLQPEVRLLTLTGPGGTGKTRLALQIATELQYAFAYGVWLVNLASIQDPALVVPAIAQALGVTEHSGKEPLQVLREVLRNRELLLVLDNFEQVLPAAPVIAELLASAASLTVLVTSRASLRLAGERELHVPPLVVPNGPQLPPRERLAQYEAVQLFVARAQAVQPAFTLTAENAAAVARICQQVDGLPLAIELAAARVKLFSPAALVEHLHSPLALLTNGPRDLPARQQTLRSTIDWSYRLLTPDEQQLFRYLGVFVGGAGLSAIAAICGPHGDHPLAVLDEVTALLDQSLIRRDERLDGEPRLVMIETLREYALEQLAAQGETEAIRAKHGAYYLRLAEDGEAQLRSSEQPAWLGRLEDEHDNLRAALHWSSQHAPDIVARLAGSLWWFWHYRGHYSEGLRWCLAALERSRGLGEGRVRAKLAVGAAMLALYHADLAQAQQLCAAGRTIAEATGDWVQLMLACNIQGTLARTQGDYAAARRQYEEGLALARASAEPWMTALALGNLGIMAFHQDDAQAAATAIGESLSLFRTIGDTWYTAGLLHILGRVTRWFGDISQAEAQLHESLALFRSLGNRWGVGLNIGGLAAVRVARGELEAAAELLGAEEAMREVVGEPLFPTIRRDHERAVGTLHGLLDKEKVTTAWARGRSLTLEQILARVRAEGQDAPARLGDATLAAR
jgi:predicted ATPase/DNA-binding XRE family transcriptional regulator